MPSSGPGPRAVRVISFDASSPSLTRQTPLPTQMQGFLSILQVDLDPPASLRKSGHFKVSTPVKQ